jgi:hypothetical protein
MRWFFRLQLAEAASCFVFWFVTFPILTAALANGVLSGEDLPLPEPSREVNEIALLLGLLLFVALLMARVLLCAVHFIRCEQSVQKFLDTGESIVAEVEDLVRGRVMRTAKLLSAAVMLWHAGGLALILLYEPSNFMCEWFGIGLNSCRTLTGVQFGAYQFFLMSCCSVLVLQIACAGVMSRCHRCFELFWLQPQQPQGGFSKDVLSKLPTFSFQPGAGDSAMCTICMESVERRQKVRKMPCGHVYHKKCIDAWLRRSPTCPLRCGPAPALDESNGDYILSL